MLLYCLKWKTDSKSSSVGKTNKRKLIILSKLAVCDTKKLRFIKEQEDNGILNSLRLRIPLRV